jgi:hypothetical protein
MELWVCFAGDTVGIYLEFKAQLTSMAHQHLQRYAIPSGLRLVPSFCFSTGQ